MSDLSIGSRMKENYEEAYKIVLPKRLPVIIRLDGRAFHGITSKCEKPFDIHFMSCMNLTALALCEEVQNTVLAYVQSDEISLLLNNYKNLDTDSWFGNELQKIVSVSAGIASSMFCHYSGHKSAHFDSRAFILPKEEVVNYFIWRQQDWERNSIQMLAQSLYSSKELYKKNKKQLHDMCFAKGHNWNDLETYKRRGSCAIKNKENGECWLIDSNIPIFTKDRNYIEKLI
jgi:tRNA(His) guanylyltransferase